MLSWRGRHMHNGRRSDAPKYLSLSIRYVVFAKEQASISQSVSQSVSAAVGKTTRLTPQGAPMGRGGIWRRFTQPSARLRGSRAPTAVLRQLKKQFQSPPPSQEDRKQLEQHFVYTSSSILLLPPPDPKLARCKGDCACSLARKERAYGMRMNPRRKCREAM